MREAVGPDIDLMCDINQRWRPEQAIDIGKRVEDAGVGLFWLEDVTAHDDYAGLARVNAALATPVAGGEYVWGIVPFRHMIEARSVDIVMIDLVRVGGITPWLKIAGMAEAFNLPVVSHVVPEIHVHLVAAVPNGLTVEYMPWMLKLYEETPAIEQRPARVAEQAGAGTDVRRSGGEVVHGRLSRRIDTALRGRRRADLKPPLRIHTVQHHHRAVRGFSPNDTQLLIGWWVVPFEQAITTFELDDDRSARPGIALQHFWMYGPHE